VSGGGVLLIVAGALVLTQVLGGDALGRLGVTGASSGGAESVAPSGPTRLSERSAADKRFAGRYSPETAPEWNQLTDAERERAMARILGGGS
jgi:hypothetical protein